MALVGVADLPNSTMKERLKKILKLFFHILMTHAMDTQSDVIIFICRFDLQITF